MKSVNATKFHRKPGERSVVERFAACDQFSHKMSRDGFHLLEGTIPATSSLSLVE
jgi:hypothetical protein